MAQKAQEARARAAQESKWLTQRDAKIESSPRELRKLRELRVSSELSEPAHKTADTLHMSNLI